MHMIARWRRPGPAGPMFSLSGRKIRVRQIREYSVSLTGKNPLPHEGSARSHPRSSSGARVGQPKRQAHPTALWKPLLVRHAARHPCPYVWPHIGNRDQATETIYSLDSHPMSVEGTDAPNRFCPLLPRRSRTLRACPYRLVILHQCISEAAVIDRRASSPGPSSGVTVRRASFPPEVHLDLT